MPTRLSKVEFPRFDGDDLEGWIFRSERFSKIDHTPAENKVTMASVHLSGKALEWHQSFLKRRGSEKEPSWDEYEEAIRARFRERPILIP